jgi:signal transduction histidine kinase
MGFMDARRINRVLTNLVENALHHTPAGGRVTVHGQRLDSIIELEVCDTGIGIPPEDLPYVFDRFFRGEKSRSRASGGSGLGLAISKGIIEAHNGEIIVESRPGRTCFTIRLPMPAHESS